MSEAMILTIGIVYGITVAVSFILFLKATEYIAEEKGIYFTNIFEKSAYVYLTFFPVVNLILFITFYACKDKRIFY